MTRLFAFLCAVALAAPAFAATTYTQDTTVPENFVRVSKVVCTTGSESAPAAATDGLSLYGLTGFSVTIEAAGAMTAGGVLQAYVRHPVSGVWARAPDLDLVVAALTNQAFGGFTVVADMARIAFVPSGVGQGSTIYVSGTTKR